MTKAVAHGWARGLVLALTSAAVIACGDDDVGDGGAAATDTSSTGAASTGAASDDTAAPPTLDEPYGPCAGPMASSECADAGPEHAACLERDGAGGVAYSVCAVSCREDADCPPVGAGNVTPQCTQGRCLLACYVDAGTCQDGTICVDGDPPTCMWPQAPVALPDAATFCDVACGACGQTLLLPWPGDCASECLADLADCSPAELDTVLTCTNGEACPSGGAGVASCLMPIACIDGPPGA